MYLIKDDYFHYSNNEMFCENVPVSKIAKEFGTPVYIYSKGKIVDNFNKFNDAFKERLSNYRIFFACKANTNINIIKTLVDCGAGVDVNSGGELYKALKAGAKPHNLIFSGVGKTAEEIKHALEVGIDLFKVESEQEILLINDVAKSMDLKARISIRVNPDVDAHTTSHITTGTSLNKFGILISDVKRITPTIKSLTNVELKGLAVHLGSQIFEIDPYSITIDKIKELILFLKSENIIINHFDLGGGYGVPYTEEQIEFPLQDLAKMVSEKLSDFDGEVCFEPGRFFVGNVGILVSKLLYSKQNDSKLFYIVDAGMNDLMRPALYGSYHHVQPVILKDNSKPVKVDVVGPVCESTDTFAKERILDEIEQNELLAFMTAGAYGFVMTMVFNGRPRVPEVIVNGSEYFNVRKRETYEQLLADEVIIEDLH